MDMATDKITARVGNAADESMRIFQYMSRSSTFPLSNSSWRREMAVQESEKTLKVQFFNEADVYLG